MEELIKVARERGIDVEDLIISALSKIDPQEGLRIRMELAKRYLDEVDEYLRKGDAVQASEKAYKAAEECVKALAEKLNIPEYQQAIREGRWYTYLLTRAAGTLSTRLGDWVSNGWSSAYVLHVWGGFHEAKLGVNDLMPYIDKVRTLVRETENVLSR
ncbi:PaREP1 family protein [Vulcanisaeta distributa]|uniref:PaREP1 family protein n=1 Tax=Vulcanisaeta distributa TaxID=164451 RepID=UPI0006D07140|nr:PaREP1 family protein [Vulcanisaeta distributa]